MKQIGERVGLRSMRLWTMIVAVLLAGGTCIAQAQDWQTFRYPDDGFSIAFPSAPRLEARNVETSAGAVELHSYVSEKDSVALLAGVCDYGPMAAVSNVDDLLQSAKKGALANSNTQLIRDSRISLGIYHGLQFEAEGKGKHVTARLYIVGTIMYQVLVEYSVEMPYNDAARFLDSFQLIERERN